jgi:hypothetical protein
MISPNYSEYEETGSGWQLRDTNVVAFEILSLAKTGAARLLNFIANISRTNQCVTLPKRLARMA